MFLFCLVFAMSLCASVYMCFVVTCWERADLLADDIKTSYQQAASFKWYVKYENTIILCKI